MSIEVKTYPKLWCSKALDNISFSINKGEIVGFLPKWRWKIDFDENINTISMQMKAMLW
jgi:hypothetical protein